jgi:hypothetical protein
MWNKLYWFTSKSGHITTMVALCDLSIRPSSWPLSSYSSYPLIVHGWRSNIIRLFVFIESMMWPLTVLVSWHWNGDSMSLHRNDNIWQSGSYARLLSGVVFRVLKTSDFTVSNWIVFAVSHEVDIAPAAVRGYHCREMEICGKPYCQHPYPWWRVIPQVPPWSCYTKRLVWSR